MTADMLAGTDGRRLPADTAHAPSRRGRLGIAAASAVIKAIRFAVESPAGKAPPSEGDIRRGTKLLKVAESVMGALPNDVVAAPAVAGGIAGMVLEPVAEAPRRHILFLPSGSFILARTRASDRVAAKLGTAAGAKVFTVDYRLAPEHPFPAALRDVTAAYRGLLAEGIPPESIALVGESAGGGLALAAAVALRDEGTPLPGALGLLCPWADMTFSGPSILENAPHDPFMSNLDTIGVCAGLYLCDTPADHPLASPVFAALHGLPPVNVHIGSIDMLRDDGKRIAERVREAGGTVRLDEWERMPHGWQRLGRVLPESAASIAILSRFLREHLIAAPAGPSGPGQVYGTGR